MAPVFCPRVETNSGPVEGFVFSTKNGDVHVFLGIPYAQPPVGELRFERPLPAKPWRHTFKAKQFSMASVPHHPVGTKVPFGEDCLTINVLAPPTRRIGGWPTVFFVHPSAFAVGSAMWVRFEGFCENVVAQGIVVVTFHYRLGILGFGSTGDSVMPGNMGMFDQELALRWTLDNIHHFGGNPHDLTAWGVSVGGMCAGLLSLSPKTRHYIKKCIQNSGSCFSALSMGESVVKETYALARLLGCPTHNSQAMKACLKTKTVEEFHAAHDKMGKANQSFTFKWLPRIDGDFFPKDLPQLIRERIPIPVLNGYATDEFVYFYNGFLEAVHNYTLTPETIAKFDQNELIRRIYDVHFTEEEYGPEARLIADRVVDYYARNNVPDNADNLYFVNQEQKMLNHVRGLAAFFIEYYQKHVQGYKVYVYQNAYWREGHFTPEQPLRGCMHVSELKQFFNAPIPSNYKFNAEDLKHKHALVQSHVNFIKTGDPSFDGIRWPPVSDRRPCQNMIIQPNPRVAHEFEGDMAHLEFWLDLVRDFGQKVVRTRFPLARYESEAVRARL